MTPDRPAEAHEPIPRRDGAGAPASAAIEAFCRYLRELEVSSDADWAAFLAAHPEHAADLASLLEQYERISAILERLQPAASFSARLRAHYGEGIDPGVSLSGDGRRRSTGEGHDAGARSSGKVLSRLSAQNPNLSRYERRKEIARGGMGAIQEVWDTELRRTLAMKVVLGGVVEPGSSQSSEDTAERRLSRFLHEAQITGQLDHPGIVPVHDIGMDEAGRVFFTMQLIDGHDLRKVFEFARLERHDWNTRRVISVLVRVCESMAYAHSKGVVHRDLKPANIMVGAFGEAYVMDWGLAKVLGEDGLPLGEDLPARSGNKKVHTDRSDSDTGGASSLQTLDGDIVGTPAYMAPEQARGKLAEVGPHSDVYAMGAMLYHLLSGHAPYEPLGEKVPAHTILDAVRKAPPWPLRQAQPEVNSELAAICEKAMAREPSLRYESMMALGEDLRAWVEGRGVGAYTTGVWYETRKWMARNMLTTIALGSIAFLLMVSVVLFIYLQQSNLSKLETEKLAKESALSDAQIARAEADAKAEEASDREAEMKVERDRADREADEARTQKQLAEENAHQLGIQTAIAQEQQKRATSTAYRSSINAAAFSLRLDELEAARRNLDACDVGLRGWEWHHLDLASDPSVGDPRVQERGVTDLAVAEGGATLLTYGFGLRPRLWDVAERKMHAVELPGPTLLGLRPQTQLARWRCAVAPNGKVVAVSNPMDNSLLLANAATGDLMSTVLEHEGAITGVCFSPDGRQLATCSEDGSVVVLTLALAPYVAQRLDAEAGPLLALAFSPDGRRIATGGADRSTRVWDVESGELELHLTGHHTREVVSIDWTPAGDRIVSASLDGSLAIWSSSDGAMTSVMHGHRGEVYDVVFGRDGETLFSAGEDRTVRMWQSITGMELRVFNGHVDEVRALVRLGDSDSLASCSRDGTLRFWDARWDPAATPLPLPGSGDCTELAFGPEGRRLLANVVGGTVAVLDADRGLIEREALNLPVDGTQDPGVRRAAHSAMVVARVSGRVAIASPGQVALYSGLSGELERTIVGFDSSITRLAISDDGTRLLAGGGSRRQLYFVDAESGEVRKVELSSSLAAIALSPDGEQAVTALTNERLQAWEFSTGRSRQYIDSAHSASVTDLTFNADGTRLASSSADRTARLWVMPELEFLGPEFGGHEDVVTAVAFSPTEARLVTGAASGSLRVWNLETHELLFHSAGGGQRIHDLCFSPDGKRLAMSASERQVQVWESDRGDERYRRRFEE